VEKGDAHVCAQDLVSWDCWSGFLCESITKDVCFVSVEMNGGRNVNDRDLVRKDACDQRRCDYTLALLAAH
jgi:hypothetical protein